MILYVSGPMTGLPEFNYPAFNAAAGQLRAAGFTVENPAETLAPKGTAWSEYLRLALAQVLRSEGVALLPGWESSKGARLEVHVAEALGMTIRSCDDWLLPT